MDFQALLIKNDFVLMEAAIIELLSHHSDICLHPRLLNSLLIYDTEGRKLLARLFHEYIDIACCKGCPMLICTPTWRANQERVTEASLIADVNADSVYFLKSLCGEWKKRKVPISIGGLMGCKNDSYKPEEALSSDISKKFHIWQARKLAAAEPDFLMAATMPAISEALGMAAAMAETQIPYIISFVINRKGEILDGTRLEDAFAYIDDFVTQKPVGYMINCAYPSFLLPRSQPDSVFTRLIGFQANASSMDHTRLDHSDEIYADDISDWGSRMVELNRRYRVKILGGCCGTGKEHLNYIVDHI